MCNDVCVQQCGCTLDSFMSETVWMHVHGHNDFFFVCVCVFSKRDPLNNLLPGLSNWYQVFKWGQTLQCSSMQLSSCLKYVSLHLLLQCCCCSVGLEPVDAASASKFSLFCKHTGLWKDLVFMAVVEFIHLFYIR